jgi:hypothetical protein
MKTIAITFDYSDHFAREISSSLRIKLAHLNYDVWSPWDYPPGEQLMHSTIEGLKRASLIIAFLGERSANVLFEVGYAYGQSKQLILISDMTALPADLRTVATIPARLGPTEIEFEILKQIERLQASEWRHQIPQMYQLRDMMSASVDRPEMFELVSREIFEKAIAEEFRSRGFIIDFPDGAHHAGFDMRILDGKGGSLLVEVKKLNPNSKVSITSVQQLLGAAHAYNDSAALLICTSEFTLSAREFAHRLFPRVVLWTLPDLARFVESRSKRRDIKELIELAESKHQ